MSCNSRHRHSETGWTTEESGFTSLQEKYIFLLSVTSWPALRTTQSPIQWVAGEIPQGVKRQGREIDQSFPSSTEVRNDGATPPLPRTSSWRRAWLICPGDNFAFYLTRKSYFVSNLRPTLWCSKASCFYCYPYHSFFFSHHVFRPLVVPT
jgi:hypothetical protein